jgi:tRNA-specific 2-thiouridylase
MIGWPKVSKVAAAMSGGIDSSVAAALCCEAGYEVVGLTMTLTPPPGQPVTGQAGAERAAQVCRILGIEHRTVDLSEEFWATVVLRFVEEYKGGRTPNPCVVCNYEMKFGLLYEEAKRLRAQRLATGHYARIHETDKGWSLLRAADGPKDQSYFLYRLVEDEKPRAIFPLGEMTKTQVREHATRLGIPVADESESQDICFLQGRSYTELVAQLIPGSRMPGEIVESRTGKVLGKHKGIAAYTIGQRQGIGVAAGEPLFVVRIDPVTNTVYVGPDSELRRKEFTVGETKSTSVLKTGARVALECKIRSTAQPEPAWVLRLDEDTCSVAFREAQRAIAPGQAAVFYRGDVVVGGGTIQKVF